MTTVLATYLSMRQALQVLHKSPRNCVRDQYLQVRDAKMEHPLLLRAGAHGGACASASTPLRTVRVRRAIRVHLRVEANELRNQLLDALVLVGGDSAVRLAARTREVALEAEGSEVERADVCDIGQSSGVCLAEVALPAKSLLQVSAEELAEACGLILQESVDHLHTWRARSEVSWSRVQHQLRRQGREKRQSRIGRKSRWRDRGGACDRRDPRKELRRGVARECPSSGGRSEQRARSRDLRNRRADCRHTCYRRVSYQRSRSTRGRPTRSLHRVAPARHNTGGGSHLGLEESA